MNSFSIHILDKSLIEYVDEVGNKLLIQWEAELSENPSTNSKYTFYLYLKKTNQWSSISKKQDLDIAENEKKIIFSRLINYFNEQKITFDSDIGLTNKTRGFRA